MSSIVVENCSVIDGRGTEPQRGMDVLVTDNRITEVRPTGGGDGTHPPTDVVRIDGAGKTVMPGLIDAHCHMTYGESLTQQSDG